MRRFCFPMDLYEIRYHPHVHTRFSDGHGTYAEVLHAAARAGLHAVQITDHNVLVEGVEGYYRVAGRSVLLLVGEEIHDRTLLQGKNHLLALGLSRDLSPLAVGHPQRLIDAVVENGGLAFLAHPIDVAVPYAGEGDFSWRDWDIRGFHGIELWNAMSEFKARIPTPAHALFYAFQFHRVARGPFPETLRLWDRLLQQGRQTVAIAGSDAHQLPAWVLSAASFFPTSGTSGPSTPTSCCRRLCAATSNGIAQPCTRPWPGATPS